MYSSTFKCYDATLMFSIIIIAINKVSIIMTVTKYNIIIIIALNEYKCRTIASLG